MGGAAILADLEARGLVHDSTDRDSLAARLDAGPITLYCGFDPTADSLHVGHLVPLLVLRRFQEYGHRPIALAGGATGMIGDPSGRSDERNLLDDAALDRNLAAIEAQLSAFLDFGGTDGRIPALLVNNRDWTAPMSVIDFLREVGKYATVNTMLAKDSVRSRIESEQGISFTEFSYMLLQANDFVHLHADQGCELQVGGSDQWGNITAGIDQIRRRRQAVAHGLTVPLVVRSDGAKFGKTAEGAVWLDARRTLPYEFHQYFLRADDRDVRRFLLQLTLLPVAEIDLVIAEHEVSPELRRAQQVLADAVTALVHGDEAVARANLAASALFGDDELTAEMLGALSGIVGDSTVGRSELLADDGLVTVLASSGLCSSRSDALRMLRQNAVSVNRRRVAAGHVVGPEDLVGGRYLLLQRGKKDRHLVVVND